MKFNWHIWALCFYVGMLSCNSPNSPDCFKSAGNPGIEERQVAGEITEIELNDLIDLVLSDRGDGLIQLEGPENLLQDVSTSFENGRLTIQNNNTCNFVRRFDHRIKVEVSSLNLERLDYWGQGNVSSQDTIRGERLVFESKHGSGDVDMSLDLDTLKVFIHAGVAGINLNGNASWFEAFHQGYGLFDASDLNCNLVLCQSNSINNMHLQVQDYLLAILQSKGNIFYSGAPDEIDLVRNGTGQLYSE